MSRQVIVPGRSLVEAARAVTDPRLQAGRWPYQWLFPGPNSRHVLAQGVIPIPGVGAGFTTILSYQVPTGMRFSLRGVVYDAQINDASWIEGSGQLVYSLFVKDTGSRGVDFLQGVVTRLGSRQSPYPILGRLEFSPEAVLLVQVSNTAAVTGAPNTAIAHLVGHTYPNSEA